MAIAITDDHLSLADSARSFATGTDLLAHNREALQGHAIAGRPAYWKTMVDLGWTGLHLGEDVGGAGAGLLELAIVVEELGAVVAPGPFLPSVIGSAVLAACGGDRIRAALLPGCADGSTIVAFAPSHQVVPDGGALQGEALVVGGIWADHLVLAVGPDLYVVPADQDGVRLVPAEHAADPALGLAHLFLDDARGERIAGRATTARAVAWTLVAAEAAGGTRAALAMALDYAKVREQFGRTIGSFQAVKHHLANMRIAVERATAVAWDAARAGATTGVDATSQLQLAGAIAASVALRAYQRNAELNIQIQGGIGFTWEHDAHLFLRRAITLAAAYGSPDDAAADVFSCVADGVRRAAAIDLPIEAETFREAAREFAERFTASPLDERRTLLVDSGYLVPHWPAPFGRAAGSVEQLVLEQEFAALDIPSLGIGGWNLLTVLQHATPEQIERWIRPGLLGEQVWCQLFSEPAAGSDAAAVQTRAARDETAGGWRITGQKVWTSGAQYCHRGLATVRTDPSAAKHRGITAVVVDLHAPGVEIRPLRQITGEALFNEVFFDDVFIPDDDVVGAVNEGWPVARATLGNERVSIGGGANLRMTAASLIDLLDTDRSARFTGEVGALIGAETAMQLINARSAARSVAGREPGAEGSITKLLLAEHMQAVSELALRITGARGIDGTRSAVLQEYLQDRAMTIAGGTSEISRNVIAERLLGLPREVMPAS